MPTKPKSKSTMKRALGRLAVGEALLTPHSAAVRFSAADQRPVIVRTYSAGVHYGYLVEHSVDAKRVVLAKNRRIWSWQGANTLTEIAMTGVGKGSKISVEGAGIILADAIEIANCTEAAAKCIEAGTWGA
jgi:hypothetical protein